MAKQRLTQGMRDRLLDLASKIVRCPPEETRQDRAYGIAAPLVRAIVEATFPPRDMKVCAKYNAAWQDDCIKLQLTAGGIEKFDFQPKTGPMVAAKTYSGQIYAADAAATDAVADWVIARDATKKARDAKIADYRTLIVTARNLEDVSEIWPEAAKIGRVPSHGLIALNDEVVARIRADVALRSEVTGAEAESHGTN